MERQNLCRCRDHHSCDNIVFILRGLPGSGKSHCAQQHFESRQQPRNLRIVSADDFFVDLGRFDGSRLQDAHNECMRSFISALMNGTSAIVDNTNTSAFELSPYRSVALSFGFRVEIVQFDCTIQTALSRNTHGVPEGTIQGMAKKLSVPLPHPFGFVRRIVTD